MFGRRTRRVGEDEFAFRGLPPTNLQGEDSHPMLIGWRNQMSVGAQEERGHQRLDSTAVAARVGRSLSLDLELDIRRPPRSVRAWWTDLPDDYVAKDPREQPHRIRVLARYPDRIELVGTWRGPLGREMLLPEPLGCARTVPGHSTPGPWASGSTMSSRHLPAWTALGCTFEPSLRPRECWGGSSQGSWGDASCACWKRGGRRPPRSASGMPHEPRGRRNDATVIRSSRDAESGWEPRRGAFRIPKAFGKEEVNQ